MVKVELCFRFNTRMLQKLQEKKRFEKVTAHLSGLPSLDLEFLGLKKEKGDRDLTTFLFAKS